MINFNFNFNFANKLAALIVFEIKENIIIKAFSELSGKNPKRAFSAYSRICHELLKSKQNLSEYLHDVIVFSNSQIIISGVKSEFQSNKYLLDAISSDINIIRELTLINPDKIKFFFLEKFNDDFVSILPGYDTGLFNYTPEYFIDYARKNGSGIYAMHKFFIYEKEEIVPVLNYDKIKLSDLKEYHEQRDWIVFNTRCFINGEPSQNVLLYGDRGTGKSSTVKALPNEFPEIRIVQLEKSEINGLFKLYNKLSGIPLKFIIFIDDLTFEENDESYHLLKQALEGSAFVRPSNILIYATTNRRHFIKETNADRDRDAFHRGDALDDNVSLSDRFGIYITFSLPDKNLYLKIVRQLADNLNLDISAEELETGAERFALKRGGRSPRVAKYYIEILTAHLNSGGSCL